MKHCQSWQTTYWETAGRPSSSPPFCSSSLPSMAHRNARWRSSHLCRLIPQAACTRYGLMIGAKCVWYANWAAWGWRSVYRLVRVLMFVLYPIAYPTARLLEHVLGKHEKGLYKRSGMNCIWCRVRVTCRVEGAGQDHGRVQD